MSYSDNPEIEQEASRRDRPSAVAGENALGLSLIGDLGGYKAINGAFGHAGGDDCLRRVAEAVGEASRTADQCFRSGGDEFVVVLPDTNASAGAEVRRRVGAAASEVCTAPSGEHVRLTCGTAGLGPEDTIQSLLATADEVLFRFKRSPERMGAAGAGARNGEDGD